MWSLGPLPPNAASTRGGAQPAGIELGLDPWKLEPPGLGKGFGALHKPAAKDRLHIADQPGLCPLILDTKPE